MLKTNPKKAILKRLNALEEEIKAIKKEVEKDSTGKAIALDMRPYGANKHGYLVLKDDGQLYFNI